MEAMGRTAEAVDALVRIGSQFPGFDDIAAEGLWNARRISLARGDQVKAVAIEQTLRSRYPQSPWLQQQLPR
jgi:Tfp pilus assembly protein PilF